MIAYDKHQCTIHFPFIEEINCINNCISHAIISEITINITLHGSNYSRLLKHFIPIMIANRLLRFHNDCL